MMNDKKYVVINGKKVTIDELFDIASTCRYGQPDDIIRARYQISSIIENYIDLITLYENQGEE